MRHLEKLEKLPELLREVPRQFWDQYVWEFCEDFLTHAARQQPAMVKSHQPPRAPAEQSPDGGGRPRHGAASPLR
jgi:hypothetical protein